MKEFTFRLKADVSYLEEQFKGGAEALKALAVQADKADDKLQVLKQVGTYVGQMDAALAKVQKKYPNLFDEIFGDVNKQITDALSPLKKMPEEMNKILSKSKIKLDSLIADPGAATVSEIKEIGDAFKAVAKAMGNTSIDFKFLDGASKNEAKIKKLVKAMRELEESYFNVNKVVASEVGDIVTPQKQKKAPKKTKKEQTVDSMSYDNLLKTIKEAKELSKKVYDGDDDAFDKLDAKMVSLQKVFKLSEDEIAQLDVILQDLDDDIDATINKLKKLLGDQFPSISDNIGESLVNSQNIKDATAGVETLQGALNDMASAAKNAGQAVGNIGSEIDEDVSKEIGSLEDKLERLRDVADQFGSDVTQRDRNTLDKLSEEDNEKELTGKKAERFEELQDKVYAADDAIDEFSQTYDKIILKLEDGKKVEILPDDKGLRDLLKFSDEGYGESFNGVGIEDIQFIRKAAEVLEKDIPQAVQTAENAMQQFQDVWKKKNDLQHDLTYKPDYLYDDVATENAKQQIDEYNEELKRLAASYIDLGGSVEDFKSKEKRAFAEDISNSSSEQVEANAKLQSELDETNQKLKEQEDLYQQVRTAIKGTLEEVVGMDFTAVALEDIEREIKDGLITTLEEAIVRFKEMNNLTDDIAIKPVGEYQRVADYWDYYQGNKFVDDDERVVKASEYEELQQKASGENISDEYKNLELLRNKIAEVEAAVINKTLAFNQEADAVEVNVKSEIDYLDMLCKKLQGVLQDIQNINNNKLNIADADEIDAIFAKLSDPAIKSEYLGLLNSKTGKVSSEYFEGGANRAEGTFKNKKDYDTMFHNHPDVSTAIPGAKDWITFVDEFANFKRQIIITKDEIATFDLSGLAEHELKELANTIKNVLDTSKYDKQWTKDTEAYGKDEATQLWIKRNTMGALSKYPGLMNVQSLRPEQIGFTDEQLQPKIDVADENKEIATLENAIDKVTAAINNKTVAFETEKNLVSQYVKDEIGELQKLINKLQKVQEAANIKLSVTKDKDVIDGSSDSTRYVTDKYGELKTWYRGLRDSMGGGLVSNRYHGGTFFTDNLDLAKEYSDYTKVESANLSMMNPLEIEGNGANWNKIEYLGNSADEASKKIKKAREELNKLAKEWNGFEGLEINDLLSESDFNEFESTLKNMLYAGENELPDQIRDHILDSLAKVAKNREDYLNVSNDDSNIYGTHDTNKFVEYAKNAGYDGVVFKNIIDSFAGDVKDLSNVIVTFSKDQIHYLDTISVDEKERQKREFDSKYKNFEEYGEYDESRISTAIDGIVENIHQLFDNIDKQVKRGLMSETESDKNKENILYDSRFDAYSSAQNIGSPEFLDFVRNSDIDVWGKDANEIMKLFEQFVESAHNEWNSFQNDISAPVETKIEEAVKETNQQVAAEQKVEQEVKQTNAALDEQITKKEKLATLDLAAQRGTLNLFSKDLKDSESSVLPEQREAYEQLVATVNEYKKSKEKIDDAEIARIREIVNGYKSAADVKRREIEQTEAQAAATKKAKDIQDKLNKSLNTKKADGQYKSAKESSAKYANSTTVQGNFALVEQAYTALQNAKQRYADRGTELSDKEQAELDELVRNVSEAYGKLNKIVVDSEKLSANKGKVFEEPINPSVTSDMDKLEQAMRQVVNTMTDGKAKFEGFNKTTGELAYRLGDGAGKFDHFKVQVDSTGTKLVGLNAGLKKTNGLLLDIASSTLSKIKSAVANITGYDLVYKLINVTKQGIQYVRDIDLALTELKKVTNETEESYAEFLQTASKTAKVVGSTVKDIVTMTAEWARLGYTMTQAASLAESTAVLLNVSEFTDATEASEALISTIQAYGYAAHESMDVVNVLNEVGKFIARR